MIIYSIIKNCIIMRKLFWIIDIEDEKDINKALEFLKK